MPPIELGVICFGAFVLVMLVAVRAKRSHDQKIRRAASPGFYDFDVAHYGNAGSSLMEKSVEDSRRPLAPSFVASGRGTARRQGHRIARPEGSPMPDPVVVRGHRPIAGRARSPPSRLQAGWQPAPDPLGADGPLRPPASEPEQSPAPPAGPASAACIRSPHLGGARRPGHGSRERSPDQRPLTGRDVYHIRLASAATSTTRVLEVLAATGGAVNVTVIPASARFPDGDVVECDLEPEVANEVIHRLRALGPLERGPIVGQPGGHRRHPLPIAEMRRPLVSDREIAPVWEVVDATIRANATYPFSFYVLLISAGLLAAVGILTNSQILIVAAMVVGPEYNAILGAALGITERNRAPGATGARSPWPSGSAWPSWSRSCSRLVIHGTGPDATRLPPRASDRSPT